MTLPDYLFAFKKDHSGLVWEVKLRGCRDMGEKSVVRAHESWAKVAAVEWRKRYGLENFLMEWVGLCARIDWMWGSESE